MDEAEAPTLHDGPPPATNGEAPPAVAGYEIDRVIGKGGMGVVWHAIELRLDRQVALKVHAKESADVAAMWKEARLAAKVGDPGVVTVLDVGHTFDGRPYYTMEYVEGTDLAVMMRDGRLPPAEALRIAAEITSAVAAAHEKGIVHRDLKPRNVMIDRSRRARVLDFGLAIRLATGADPKILAGSPPYMPPEQVLASAIGHTADVYAIGVMLFEMLTGRRPFEAQDQAALFHKICFQAAPAPSSIAPVHPDIERIVLRCLAKAPKDRFESATALLDAINAVREGKPPPDERERSGARPRSTQPPPKTNKPLRSDAQRTFKWTWALRSPPEALWSFVADTDRFNEAVGLGTVEVEERRESPETTAHLGTAKAMGLEMRWREYPFEWIKDREHTVFRWYRAGPLEALWNRVALSRRDDGGTDLVHEIALIPRGVLGRVAAAVEIGQRLRRAMDRVYRHIDEVVSSGRGADPYDGAHEPSSSGWARVEEGKAALASAGFAPKAIDALARMLLYSPSRKLARMRPFALAAELGVPRETALALMLHAAHFGLLEIAWDVVCPTCMVAHQTEHHLDRVKGQARCDACETEYERDLNMSVELVFRAHPDVRSTKVETYCAGSPARRPHIFAQLVLDPGEERAVKLTLPPGDYTVGAFGVGVPSDLAVSPVGHAGYGEVVIAERAIAAARSSEARVRSETAIALYPAVLREGEVMLRFINDTPDERTVRVETHAARADSVPAVLALTHPTFRDFFGTELLSYGELIGVSHLFFLAVDASDRGALFADRGDAEACAALRAFEGEFARAVREEGGTVLPGPLETLVAAFPSGGRALRAAVDLLDASELPVRAAVHGGRCLALTREMRIDYFGETLHRTLWLASAAEPHELVLSQMAAGDRDVALAVHAAPVETRADAASAGPYKGRRVIRVRPRRAA